MSVLAHEKSVIAHERVSGLELETGEETSETCGEHERSAHTAWIWD